MPKKEFYRITVDGIPYVVEVEPIQERKPQRIKIISIRWDLSF